MINGQADDFLKLYLRNPETGRSFKFADLAGEGFIRP